MPSSNTTWYYVLDPVFPLPQNLAESRTTCHKVRPPICIRSCLPSHLPAFIEGPLYSPHAEFECRAEQSTHIRQDDEAQRDTNRRVEHTGYSARISYGGDVTVACTREINGRVKPKSYSLLVDNDFSYRC